MCVFILHAYHVYLFVDHNTMDPSDNKCVVCGKVFAKHSVCLKHMRVVHDMDISSVLKRGIRCGHSDCVSLRRCYSSMAAYRDHLRDDHQVDGITDSDVYRFKSRDEFLSWKIEKEKQDKAQFIALSGSRLPSGGGTVIYTCSRSGIYKSKSTNKRLPKSQGSKKCGQVCPASMVLRGSEDDFTVHYYSNHFGHEIELCHLALAKDEKQHIAADLMKGVPSRRIRQNICATLVDTCDRVHLTTTKDISNVKVAYNLDSCAAGVEQIAIPAGDAFSIHGWVTSCKDKGADNPVLYYKQQGDDVEELGKEIGRAHV